MIKIKFIKTHEDARLPIKNHHDDACYDLFAIEDTLIPTNGCAVVPVGLKVGYIEPGYYIKIEGRSGNGFKKGLEPHPGIIDSGYRGDMGIKLFNFSKTDQIIQKHKGVAQFSIHKVIDANIE